MSTGTEDAAGTEDEPLRLLTLRVSRDGGRTWGAPRAYRVTDRPAPLGSSVWPPCLCPRCARDPR